MFTPTVIIIDVRLHPTVVVVRKIAVDVRRRFDVNPTTTTTSTTSLLLTEDVCNDTTPSSQMATTLAWYEDVRTYDHVRVFLCRTRIQNGLVFVRPTTLHNY